MRKPKTHDAGRIVLAGKGDAGKSDRDRPDSEVVKPADMLSRVLAAVRGSADAFLANAPDPASRALVQAGREDVARVADAVAGDATSPDAAARLMVLLRGVFLIASRVEVPALLLEQGRKQTAPGRKKAAKAREPYRSSLTEIILDEERTGCGRKQKDPRILERMKAAGFDVTQRTIDTYRRRLGLRKKDLKN